MSAALLLVDLQCAVDDRSCGARNNPTAEKNVKSLLREWRASARPIYHLRHDSTATTSVYHPGHPGHEFKPEAMPQPDETIVAKHNNNAFVGTPLEQLLRGANHNPLFFAGAGTNHSVESTVRMAGNLGFAAYLIEDASFAFERIDWGGRRRSAQEVHDMSLANLHGEYCTVVTTAQVLEELESEKS